MRDSASRAKAWAFRPPIEAWPSRVAGLIAWMLLVVCSLGAIELPFHHYTPRSGEVRLPSSSVQAILQDDLGYLWFGLYSSGLVRFDGHSLDSYGPGQGVTNGPIRAVQLDGSGRLWAGGDGGLVVSEKPLRDLTAGETPRFVRKLGGQESCLARACVRPVSRSTVAAGSGSPRRRA